MRPSCSSISIICFFLLCACIDPIRFDTGNESPRIVVEGLITNVSYNERLTQPAEPRRFYVKVQYTGPVNNERNDPVDDAVVTLYDDQGGSWQYEWENGLNQYTLPFDDFSAEPGRNYHVEVKLSNGEIYQSQPERMHVSQPLTEVEQELETRVLEIDKGGQIAFQPQEGVTLSAVMPVLADEETFYYRYRVIPSWVYVAPLPPEDSPVKTCYVTNIYYFQKIFTRLERKGGFPLELFFLKTVSNTRLKHDFTAYVTQYSLSPEAWEFWDQLALQQESGGGIFDPPPFELTGNLYNVNDPQEKVSGFFSVAHESSVRWYINESELPYKIDLGINPCSSFPVTEDCVNCLKYRGGSSSITNIRPEWWRNY